ncbi:hypothetical protein [Salinirubrum litoreum]|uniref:CARDB domain-containing protein n=1 Tax=Salinirubrum litoreum TaxID=1126234 RepID=A0ABD5RGC4_9EURY|nr:hypothetical protein [Salinirubrum litoreum]
MRRRALLVGCAGTLGGLAGCLTGGRDDPAGATDQSETPRPTDRATATPTPSPSVSASLISLQPAVVTFVTDSITVSGETSQYLFVAVDVEDGEPPAVDEFTFWFAGAEAPPLEPQGSYWSDYNPGATRYSRKQGEGWLAFDLPATGDASGAALRWPGGEWTPPQALRERLSAPAPPLSLEWSVPETAELYTTPTLGFTVTNTGELDGRFVAALNRIGPRVAYAPITSVSRRIPAGETLRFEVTDRFDLDDPGGDEVGDEMADLSYVLQLPEGERRREVRLVE